jgi:tight adherence protein B
VLNVVACTAAVALGAIILRAVGRPPALSPAPDGRSQPWSRRAGAIGSVITARLTGPIRARRRQRALELAWPGVADELAAGLRTGASLPQALATVAATRTDDASLTLRRLLGPVERGQALAEGGGRWAERAVSVDEQLLAEAVQLAAWAGRPEPVLFDAVADAGRERQALAGELRAQTAQARASAAVMAVLPVGFTALTAMTNAGAAHFLLTTTGGWACIVTGLTLEVLGGVWMRTAIRRAAR